MLRKFSAWIYPTQSFRPVSAQKRDRSRSLSRPSLKPDALKMEVWRFTRGLEWADCDGLNAVAARLAKGRPLKTEQVTLEASNVEKQDNTLIAFAKP